MKQLRDYIPRAKWEAWHDLPRKERALQIAAYLVDTLKVRETNGSNRGEVLDAVTRQAGYDPADRLPWCAMFVTACLTLAGYRHDEIPESPGAVARWRSFGKDTGRYWSLSQWEPSRGDLVFWLNQNGTGHIGFFVRKKLTVLGWRYETLEGNTSSGDEGSQREGDGAFRRLRKPGTWQGAIRLPT